MKENYEKIETRYVVVKQDDDNLIGCGHDGIEMIDLKNKNRELWDINLEGFDQLIKSRIQESKIPFGGMAHENNQFSLIDFIEII